MKNTWIKVKLFSPRMKIANIQFNKEEILKNIKQNIDASILLFPELSLTGYTCQDLFFQKSLLDESVRALTDIATETKEIENTIILGLPISYQNKLYNCAAYLSNGKILGIVPKIHIPNYSEFYEARWFASGKDIRNRTIRLNGEEIPFGIDLLFEDRNNHATIATEICEDLWVPNRPSIQASLNGANIVVNPSASDETIGKKNYRRNMVKQVSGEEYCLYLYTSSAMEESSTDLVFSGHQLIAYNGSLIKESIYPEENRCLSAVIDLEKSNYNRIHQSTFINKEENLYRYIPTNIKPLGGKYDSSCNELVKILKEENLPVDRNPFVPKEDQERKEHCEEILKIQTMGLVTRLRNTGIRNLIIGVSGGLDSTLALLVLNEAKKIQKDIQIFGYTLPNRGNTSDITYTNSINLMKALNITPHTIPIEEGVKLHLNQIGHSLSYEGKGDVTYENAQARMRTYLLMDLANFNNGIVIGTGDLSELALGWCTYNGDHMSMYGVNASVPKTLVKYIVRNYADTIASPELSKTLHSIVDTPISPELTPSKDGKIMQKTEDAIGKYDLNDFFLYYFLRYGMTPEEILSYSLVAYPEIAKETMKVNMERFYRRFFSQQFKRSCLPDGPKVGSVTLSPRGDFRMSSDCNVEMILDILNKA